MERLVSKDGTIIVTTRNKDGSSDTYTITGAKEGQQKVAGMTNMYTDRIPGTSGGGPG